MGNESSPANHLVLQRDAGTFTFISGSFRFLAPVQGKITGAIFSGEGSFVLVPPTEEEKRSLSHLTKEPSLTEHFNQVVLRFTDNTYEEIKKAAGVVPATGDGGSGLLGDTHGALKHQLHYNLDGRLLQDVLGTQPGGFFLAFIKGRKYSGKMIYAVDPHGISDFAFRIAPEEIMLATYDDNKTGVWAAFHYSSEIAEGKASGDQRNGPIHIQHQKLDTEIEKSGKLNGNAITTFVARQEGMRVVPLELFPTLRVASVTDVSGHPLDFIQEDKDEDPDFSVILPQPLHAGESYTTHIIYRGSDAVKNAGGGNYYPVAREDWYPSSFFGDYATYDMTFRVPKEMVMVATGTRTRDGIEGNENLTEWHSDGPITVAGFNFGSFKRQEAKVDPEGYIVQSYANKNEPDVVRSIKDPTNDHVNEAPGANGFRRVLPETALGTMNTQEMAKKALAEGALSMRLYSDYFGPPSAKRLAMTQQTAFNYGQSWPGLVYMPITAFFDSTTRHGIHMDDPLGYFKVVGPHEVAHQWWAHTVGFNSYRDQWMSEGFSDFSASLFLQNVYGQQQFRQFWDDERHLLTERNKEGHRAIDVGPVTLGYRLANSKSGFDIPRRLIYPKGAYILHMIRMMMWSPRTRDDDFKALMKDFSATFANQVATTEDFKAMVEKHITRAMDIDGNHRMDWFFNEYVYGTALPSYKLDYSFDKGSQGMILNLKLTQANVDDSFRMLIPLYFEMGDGKIVRLGNAAIHGNKVVQQQIPLNGLKEKPRRVMLNYYNDVLCSAD